MEELFQNLYNEAKDLVGSLSVSAPLMEQGLTSLDLERLTHLINDIAPFEVEDSFLIDCGSLETAMKVLEKKYVGFNAKLEVETINERLPQFGPCSLSFASWSFSLPHSRSFDDLSEVFLSNRHTPRKITDERWDPRQLSKDTGIFFWASLCDSMTDFDFQLFLMSRQEAITTDPQHRVVLQEAWSCLEKAGVSNVREQDIGVYVGVSKNDYFEQLRLSKFPLNPFISTGSVHSIIANRVSFFFDLKGPSISVDTACSSALVALHLGRNDVLQGRCKEGAIVSGVNAIFSPTMFLSHRNAGMLSERGRCASFDVSADGYVRGEGCACFFVKNIEESTEAQSVKLISSAVTHSGRSSGLTVPRSSDQSKTMSIALKSAMMEPHEVSSLESHGTGTPLGDPLEFKGIAHTYLEKSRRNSLVLGAVKSTFGHLESCSGALGVVRVLFSFYFGWVPKILHFESLNPRITPSNSVFPCERVSFCQFTSLASSVSSFGMGGVNSHLILKKVSPECSDATKLDRFHGFLRLSCEPEVYSVYKRNLMDHLVENSTDLKSLSNNFNTRRMLSFSNRWSFYCSKDLVRQLLKEGENVTTEPERNDVPKDSNSYLSFPTYPFRRIRCVLGNSFSSLAHPQMEEIKSSKVQFEFRKELFFLKDHVVRNISIVPGVMYIELARQCAFESISGLKNVKWHERGVVSDDVLSLTVSANETAVEIRKLETLLFSADLLFGSTRTFASSPSFLSGKILHSADIYRKFEKHGLAYGTSFQVMQTFKAEGRYAWSEITSHDCPLWSSFALHPAVMDGVFQTCVMHHITMHSETSHIQFLPYGLSEIHFLQPVKQKCFAIVENTHSSQHRLEYNMDLFDADSGVLLVKFSNFVRLPYAEDHVKSNPCEFYCTVWKKWETSSSFKSRIARFDGAGFVHFEDKLIPSIDAKDFAKALKENKISRIFMRTSEVNLSGCVNLLQKIFRQGLYPIEVLVLLDKSESDDAMFCGLARTVKFENPEVRMACFWVSDDQRAQVEYIVDAPLHEVPALCELRISSGEIQERMIEKMLLPREMQKIEQKEKSSFIISGGLGGLGQMVVSLVIDKFNGHAIILGRTSYSVEELKEKTKLFHSKADCISYICVDVSDLSLLEQRLNSEVLRNVKGVFHCAGVISDAFIINKDMQVFANVVKAKVDGALNLDTVTRDCKLDFFIMFSSIAAVLPNQGQVDYACANSFLDSFSRSRNKLITAGCRQGFSLSIGWSLWESGGMQVTEDEKKHLRDNFGIIPIETEQGKEAMMTAIEIAMEKVSDHVIIMSGGSNLEVFCQGKRNNTRRTVNEIEMVIRQALMDELALSKEEINNETEFGKIGVTSLVISGLNQRIEKHLGQVSKTLFFEFGTFGELIKFLKSKFLEDTITPESSEVINFSELKLDKMMFDFECAKSDGTTRITRFHPAVDGFFINQNPSVPGGVFVELALELSQMLFPKSKFCSVRRNFWPKSLSFFSTKELVLNIKFIRISDVVTSFEIFTEQGLHASGDLWPIVPASENFRCKGVNASVAQNVVKSVDKNEFYDAIPQNADLSLTGRFRLVEGLEILDNGCCRAWAELENDLSLHFVIHPVVITAVEQVLLVFSAISLKDPGNLKIMPVAIESINAISRIPQRVLIFAEQKKLSSTTCKYDVSVFNAEDLSLVVFVEGNTLKIDRISPEKSGLEVHHSNLDISFTGLGVRISRSLAAEDVFLELAQKSSLIAKPPNGRYASPPPVEWGCYIERLEYFDADCFNISPREAKLMDPQHRMCLECSWEALGNAGFNIESRDFQKDEVGVFVGIGKAEYTSMLYRSNVSDGLLETGSWASGCSGRISYMFGFQGKSISLDTACSSSLVAVGEAASYVRSRKNILALAAGVNCLCDANVSLNYYKAGMLSSDGRCKTFDASANGYVRGESCIVLVVEKSRESDLHLIKASSVNQDGRSVGLTAPNGAAQERLISSSLEQSGIVPQEVTLMELHGTGTPLGDPIEVRAVTQTVSSYTRGRILLSSAKTNVGHHETASGVVSLLKVLLSFQHFQTAAPHLHLKTLNPQISQTFGVVPIENVILPKKWVSTVSSFGFTGTNAFVVLASRNKLEGLGHVKFPLLVQDYSAENFKRIQSFLEQSQINESTIQRFCFNRDFGAIGKPFVILCGSRKDIRDGEFLSKWEGRATVPLEVVLVASKCGSFLGDKSKKMIRFLYTCSLHQRDKIAGLESINNSEAWFLAGDMVVAMLKSYGVLPAIICGEGHGLCGMLSQNHVNHTSHAGSITVPKSRSRDLFIWIWRGSRNSKINSLGAHLFLFGARRGEGFYNQKFIQGFFALAPLKARRQDASFFLSSLTCVVFRRKPFWHDSLRGNREIVVNLKRDFYYRLEEHLIYGKKIVPGGFHVAMVACLFREIFDISFVELKNLQLPASLDADAEPEIVYRFKKNADESLSVKCLGISSEVIFADAVVSAAFAESTPLKSTEDVSRMVGHSGVVFRSGVYRGASLQWVKETMATPDGRVIWSRLEPPQTWAPSLTVPVELIDVIFAALVNLPGTTDFHAPFVVDNIKINLEESNMQEGLELWTRQNTDADVLVNKKLFCQVRGLISRAAPKSLFVDRSVKVVQPFLLKWEKNQSVAGDSKASLVRVSVIGASDEKITKFFQVKRHFVQVSLDSEQLDGVILLQGLSPSKAALQQILHHLSTFERHIWHILVVKVSCSIDDVRMSPWAAAIWGFARVARSEFGVVSVVGCTETINDIPFEKVQVGHEIVWNNGVSFHPTVFGNEKSKNMKNRELCLKNSTVVVSGGLGGLGKALCLWISKQNADFLVIFSRSTTKYENISGPVLVCQVDVSLVEDVQSCLSRTFRGGDKCFVFHVAGVLHDQLLRNVNWTEFNDVMQAKVCGLRSLSRVFCPNHLVLFSSAASWLATLGQASYVAANSFMDSYAQQRKNVVSILWGPWNSGMYKSTGGLAKGISLNEMESLLQYSWESGYRNLGLIVPDWPNLKTDSFVLRNFLHCVHGKNAVKPLNIDRDVISTIERAVRQVLQLDPKEILDIEKNLSEVGLDSISGLELRNELSKNFGSLPAAFVLDNPSVKRLASKLEREKVTKNSFAPMSKSVVREEKKQRSFYISGPACRVGRAKNLSELSNMLLQCSDFATVSLWPQRCYTRVPTSAAYFLEGIENFDDRIFQMSPLEGKILDPNVRLAMQCSWESFESCGIDPLGIEKAVGRCSSFFGGTQSGYLRKVVESSIGPSASDPFLLMSGDFSRVNFFFNLTGSSATIFTACSSASVCVVSGISHLQENHSSIALCVGVHTLFDEFIHYSLKAAGLLSVAGHCKTFDTAADGYARSEACGSIILFRELPDRKSFRVCEWATCNDGRTSSPLSPNLDTQSFLFSKILDTMSRSDVSTIVPHGMGSLYVDAIEATALAEAFADQRTENNPKVIGSPKTFLGHSEAASGALSLLCCCIFLDQSFFSKHDKFETLNPKIDSSKFERAKLCIASEQVRYEENFESKILENSFGVGGTTVCIVLANVPKNDKNDKSRLNLSAFCLKFHSKDEFSMLKSAVKIFVIETLSKSFGMQSCGSAKCNMRCSIFGSKRKDLIDEVNCSKVFSVKAEKQQQNIILLCNSLSFKINRDVDVIDKARAVRFRKMTTRKLAIPWEICSFLVFDLGIEFQEIVGTDKVGAVIELFVKHKISEDECARILRKKEEVGQRTHNALPDNVTLIHIGDVSSRPKNSARIRAFDSSGSLNSCCATIMNILDRDILHFSLECEFPKTQFAQKRLFFF